jgi:putative DNA primase/helicase
MVMTDKKQWARDQFPENESPRADMHDGDGDPREDIPDADDEHEFNGSGRHRGGIFEPDNPFTEDALALRFSERHKDDLRYIATKGVWLKWDGTRWYAEATHLAFDLARRSCRDDAQSFGNGKVPSQVYSAKAIAAVERMAKTDRRQATTVEQWDAADFVFNAEMATFDLITSDAYVPRPSDYITKKATCHCAPQGTPHPVWTAFLERIAPDPELRAFLQRFIGYCLTGTTSEHKFVFSYGTGANGKGTFINTVSAIFADYATVADVGTFIASNTERHPANVAKLHGYRLVVAQETEKGRRWDETKIKSMTGGDKMTARFMRQDFFDFAPKFKLWIVGNHKPRLNNVDEAMRRRMLLVPFLVQIPPEERDTELPEKLKAEWPAILRWALDGCLEWQRIGLAPPQIVTAATDEYFEDQDTTKQWLEDCTADGGPYAFTPTNQLFTSWREWCVARNLFPGTGNAFSDGLADRGYTRKKGTGGVRGFRGLTLRTT